MASLVSLVELEAYLQRSVNTPTAELILGLVDDAILGHPIYGQRITSPPQRGLKGLALEVARRALLNPSNVASESANGTSVTYVTGAGGRGVDLTDRELARLAEIVGVGHDNAYTVGLVDDGLSAPDWSQPLHDDHRTDPRWPDWRR